MVTALGSAIDFLRDFGFFEVILPFLLIFTIVFAVLEKTKIFGVVKIDGIDYPKKNLNSMVAFAISFFAIAAKEVVEAIQVSLPQVALGLVFIISFMMLAGSFFSDKEFSFDEHKGWKGFLIFLMFIAILLIFLNSLGWLQVIIDALAIGEILVPVVLVVVVIGIILYVVGIKKPGGGSSGSSGDDE